METITAIGTGNMTAGISIIRVSGDDAISIAQKLLPTLNLATAEPRHLYLTSIISPQASDKSIAVLYKAPISFTGEDIVEFQLHGGQVLTQTILQALIDNGARLANPGEFSQRAFINGKMSLDALEGVADLINAQSQAQLRANYHLIRGKLHEKTEEIQSKITDLIAEIEVAMDYPEEELSTDTREKSEKVLRNVSDELATLIESYQTGQIIKNGVIVSILGKPNVGKSSLLNSMLGFNRAIVTDIPGTTRDTIEENYEYKGVLYQLIDTAGIRSSEDTVERIGIEKSIEALRRSNVALFIIDSTKELTQFDMSIAKIIKDSGVPCLIIYNKIDCIPVTTKELLNEFLESTELGTQNILSISTSSASDILQVKKRIFDSTLTSGIDPTSLYITNSRHYNCIKKAFDLIQNAITELPNTSLDCITLDLRNAWNYLGEITGRSITNDVLDSIFSKFCLGK